MGDTIQKFGVVSIEPGHGTGGRHPSRAGLDRPIGNQDPGMFGRMFPELPPMEIAKEKLDELGAAMKDKAFDPAKPDEGNASLPAGFTYLGQFIDHDITLDLTSLGDKSADPDAIENFRTPALDLDSIYGLGPDGSRPLYARNDPTIVDGKPQFSGKRPGPKFFFGETVLGGPGNISDVFPNDLPRSPEGFALIGDHRNDENLLVAQTHLALLKFHNKVCDQLAGKDIDVFKEARRIVTWHYQWMVLHDFVERVTSPGIVAKILHDGRKFYRFRKFPYIPVEFSGVAYRFGHSMVRETYSHNRVFTRGGEGGPASLKLLFDFSGLSGVIVGDFTKKLPQGTFAFPSLPSNWVIDWRRYHDFSAFAANPDGVPLNRTRKIDPFLTPALHDLPGGGGNLASLNLRRGLLRGLPSGQDVAKAMGIKKPLTPDEIATGSDGAVAKQHGMHEKTPLWYYILKEAEQRGEGERLGPVGATIISEVFVGLVHGDHDSYLWLKGKDWKPDLPSAVPGTFTMADLLQFVGDVSPLDKVKTVP